jgi:PAS domain S-box-containing protein
MARPLHQERRQSSWQLNASDERLRLAADVALLGTFEWDLVADSLHFDERMLAIYGLPAGTEMGNLVDGLKLVHPLDRDFIERAAKEAIAGNSQATQQFRIVRPDGSNRWVAAKGTVQRDAQGKPIRLIGVLQDINELKCAEEELRAQTEKLHYLSRQLLAAQETERRRVAHELHDEIGQGLTAALITLQVIQQNPASAALAADLDDCAGLLEGTLQQVRAMSLDLRPAMLDDLGLAPALQWHLDRVGQRSGLLIRFGTSGLSARLPAELETVCYRVTQEALTNIVRHAQARQVDVDICRQDKEVRLAIHDDGRGFDPPAARTRAQAGGSLGLLSMEERVTLLGGRLELQSAPGQGCRIVAWLPVT